MLRPPLVTSQGLHIVLICMSWFANDVLGLEKDVFA